MGLQGGGAMKIGKARELVEAWKTILNIPEWTVSVRWGTKREMDGVVGTCVWSPEELAAQILLARTQENYEQTIIHELLHIVLEGHKPMNGRYSELQERAINRIADGLLALGKS